MRRAGRPPSKRRAMRKGRPHRTSGPSPKQIVQCARPLHIARTATTLHYFSFIHLPYITTLLYHTYTTQHYPILHESTSRSMHTPIIPNTNLPDPPLPYSASPRHTLLHFNAIHTALLFRPDLTFDSLHYNILSGPALPSAIERNLHLHKPFLPSASLIQPGPVLHDITLHYITIYTFAFHKPNRLCPGLSCSALVVANQTLLHHARSTLAASFHQIVNLGHPTYPALFNILSH